jgi:hypothetical protein
MSGPIDIAALTIALWRTPPDDDVERYAVAVAAEYETARIPPIRKWSIERTPTGTRLIPRREGDRMSTETQQETIDRYRAALERIANMDYRGNRSPEQEIAYRALRAESGEARPNPNFIGDPRPRRDQPRP